MSRVEINAGGRHIIIDHDAGDLSFVVDKAEALWKTTATPEEPPGPAYGFQADRRWTPDTEPTGNGRYSTPTGPITA